MTKIVRKGKALPVILVFTSILIIGLALDPSYTLWSETLNVNMAINTGDCNVKICCYKVKICPCSSPLLAQAHSIDGDKSLYVHLDDFNNESRLWIGFLICNKGSLPAMIKGINIAYVSGSKKLFDSLVFQSFYYGPFSSDDPGLWSCFSQCPLPFNWNRSVPFTLEPNCKAIILIQITSTFNVSADVDFIVSVSNNLAMP